MPARTQLPRAVTLRLAVEGPVPGVRLAVQRGRDGLLQPAAESPDETAFEWRAAVVDGPDGASVRGPEVQGPLGARFVYLNVGLQAGQAGSPWDRRAKVPLATLTPTLLTRALAAPEVVLEARVAGAARDGGPACAAVPLLGGGWRVASGAGAQAGR